MSKAGAHGGRRITCRSARLKRFKISHKPRGFSRTRVRKAAGVIISIPNGLPARANPDRGLPGIWHAQQHRSNERIVL
jgi:hypothetical protein